MRVPAELLDEIDFPAVVAAELASRNRFLPPNFADAALQERFDEVASWLATVMKRDITPIPQDTVMARKSRAGSRPLPYRSLQDRLVYRALVSTIESRLPLSTRGEDAYEEFVRFPLREDDCSHVMKTDVAAYYQYIDHERLVDEIVSQTGDDLAITAGISSLQQSSGRRFGLPQMSDPSDVLADVYIEPVRRALLRGQHRAQRYADDFRVACADYDEALTALEIAEREAHELGLVLNEDKTSTPKIETYRDALDAVTRAEGEVFGRLPDNETEYEGDPLTSFFLPDRDDYGEARATAGNLTLGATGAGAETDEIDPPGEADPEFEPTTRQVEAARLVVDLWSHEEEETRLPGYEPLGWSKSTRSTVLRKAVQVLRLAKDDHALHVVTAVLVKEPHLMPQLSRYMEDLATEIPGDVRAALDNICERNIVSVWQAVWMAYCIGTVPASKRPVERIHTRWLWAQLTNEHPAIAAQAALSLARRGHTTAGRLAPVYERLPEVHRPTVLMALAVARDTADVPALARGWIEREQARWASRRWAPGRRQTRRSEG